METMIQGSVFKMSEPVFKPVDGFASQINITTNWSIATVLLIYGIQHCINIWINVHCSATHHSFIFRQLPFLLRPSLNLNSRLLLISHSPFQTFQIISFIPKVMVSSDLISFSVPLCFINTGHGLYIINFHQSNTSLNISIWTNILVKIMSNFFRRLIRDMFHCLNYFW